MLAYHAIADVVDPVLRPYGVTGARVRAAARRPDPNRPSVRDTDGGADAAVGGGGVPRRSVLITFDDCYEDLASAAVPVLRRHGVAALAFAVSGLVGWSNRWDERAGRRSIPLLDAAGLADLQAAGVEVGAHSRSHPRLPELDDEELADEVMGRSTTSPPWGCRGLGSTRIRTGRSTTASRRRYATPEWPPPSP